MLLPHRILLSGYYFVHPVVLCVRVASVRNVDADGNVAWTSSHQPIEAPAFPVVLLNGFPNLAKLDVLAWSEQDCAVGVDVEEDALLRQDAVCFHLSFEPLVVHEPLDVADVERAFGACLFVDPYAVDHSWVGSFGNGWVSGFENSSNLSVHEGF